MPEVEDLGEVGELSARKVVDVGGQTTSSSCAAKCRGRVRAKVADPVRTTGPEEMNATEIMECVMDG